MKFEEVAEGAAPKRVVLQPSAFASDWPDRPKEDVCIGLRFISVSDVDVARNTAVRRAVQWMTEDGRPFDERAFDETLNDQLIYVLVSRAAVDANDITAPYFPLPAEDTIREALTVEGARRLWDELQILHAGSGPAIAQASDEELHRLATILRRGEALASAAPAIRVEVRRMATYLLEQLGKLDPEATADDADLDDVDDDVEVFEVRASA